MPLIFDDGFFLPDQQALDQRLQAVQINIPPSPRAPRIGQPRGQEEFYRQLYNLPEFPPDGSLC